MTKVISPTGQIPELEIGATPRLIKLLWIWLVIIRRDWQHYNNKPGQHSYSYRAGPLCPPHDLSFPPERKRSKGKKSSKWVKTAVQLIHYGLTPLCDELVNQTRAAFVPGFLMRLYWWSNIHRSLVLPHHPWLELLNSAALHVCVWVCVWVGGSPFLQGLSECPFLPSSYNLYLENDSCSL